MLSDIIAMIRQLRIQGLRGFAEAEDLTFALPTGAEGSGLTILVGANNSGKTTIIEALRAIAQHDPPSFTQGRRNISAGDIVDIQIKDESGAVTTLRSVQPGSSEAELHHGLEPVNRSQIVVLPSRRTFNPFFTSKGEIDRSGYMTQMGFPTIRTSSIDPFSFRLFNAHKNRNKFNNVLSKVLFPVPDWTIDQFETGQYYLKFRTGASSHSSEGLGDGLVSLFFIIDALYDSADGDMVVIDEPELSLHPSLQRKLAKLIIEYAAHRQIVLATHSPYFVSLSALQKGATIARCYITNNRSVLRQPSADTIRRLKGILYDLNNPHTFGLNAQEVFFLEDRVILVEGQEDVIFYQRIQELLGIDLQGDFFGWGVGGAEKMGHISTLLGELGFTKVVGILDADKQSLSSKLQAEFSEFRFFCIPAKDVRTKPAVPSRPSVEGLLDSSNSIVRPEHTEHLKAMFTDINSFLQ